MCFTGSYQYRQTRTAHWTVRAVETPKKGDTAVDEARSQQLTEKARKMHLKNGMVRGSQLVIFRGLFVLSMLNNSCVFHSQGRMEIICHFLVYSKLPLCINSSSSGKSNKSLTTRQDLEHGISHVLKLNLFFHRIFMHID